MITNKSAREIEFMRQAGWIVAKTLEVVEPYIKPGVSTYELDQICEKTICSYDATPSFKGYQGFSGSICSSVNEVLVHGIPSKNVVLKDGDIITIDVGANYKGYHGDGAWTFAVGDISDEAKQLMQVTHDALYKGIEQVAPNVHLGTVSHAIGSYIKQFGYGIPMDYTGHGIGRNLHEDPAIFNDGQPNKGVLLKEGMTICIEPMVQAGKPFTKVLRDNWTVISKDKSLTAHYEHTIVVTKDGCEILTTTNQQEEH